MFAQNFVRMLPHRRRLGRRPLGFAVDVEGARDRLAGLVRERHDDARVACLVVGEQVIQRVDDAKGDAGRIEDLSPLLQRLFRKHLVVDLDQLRRVRLPVGLHGIFLGQVHEPDRMHERRILPRLVDHRQNEPASVLAAIGVAQRVQHMGTLRPRRKFCADQFCLHEVAVRPQAVRHQRGVDMAAHAGLLAPPERRHDRAIERHGARMIAHAGRRAGRHCICIGAHHVHQPGARPVGGGIEAGLLGLGAVLAIGGEGGVDQTRVQVFQVAVAGAQFSPHRERHVGDEDVGLLDQLAQYLVAAFGLQVERKPALVAVVEDPGVVAVHQRRAGAGVKGAVEITFARRLDLDHVGAEVGKDRRGRRRGNEARAIDHPQSGEQPRHRVVVSFKSFKKQTRKMTSGPVVWRKPPPRILISPPPERGRVGRGSL